MRHGWKTRFIERIYFEEKKEERERNRILRAMAVAELSGKLRDLDELMGVQEVSHETH